MKKVLTIRYHILKRREERINKRKKKPKWNQLGWREKEDKGTKQDKMTNNNYKNNCISCLREVSFVSSVFVQVSPFHPGCYGNSFRRSELYL
jgi:hypothetical protein